MPLPIMKWVSGQGGQISINNTILQVETWRLGRRFTNPDVTNTGCGGWRYIARVLTAWQFEAKATFDSNNPPPQAALVNGVWVPTGYESGPTYPASGIYCIFQLRASLLQYRGYGELDDFQVVNSAVDVVRVSLTGTGSGPLLGPVAANPNLNS